jgi:hypothetical protein
MHAQRLVKLLTAKVIRATMPADVRLCVASRTAKDSSRDSRRENGISPRRGRHIFYDVPMISAASYVFHVERKRPSAEGAIFPDTQGISHRLVTWRLLRALSASTVFWRSLDCRRIWNRGD